MTPDDKRRYQREWVQKRREKYLKEYGPCVLCDTEENLEIHHKNPDEKTSHRIWSWSDARIRAELKKCKILCRSCHTKIHTGETRKSIVHGTRNGYDRHGCRCDLCKQASWSHRKKYA